MRIKIDDIPIEGKDVSFSLDNEQINSRIASASLAKKSKKSEHVTDYNFVGDTKASIRLLPKGETIYLSGEVSGEFLSPCARCGDDVKEKVNIPIEMYLKPRKAKVEDEDVGYGFHDGEYVDCGAVTEEMLVLSLPMIVRCPDDSDCASSASEEGWVFGGEGASSEQGDERLKIFRTLKVH